MSTPDPEARHEQKRSIAGIVDVGIASLSLLTVGVFAARSLDLATLGAYALCLSAVLLASSIPYNLIYLPALAESTSADPTCRLGYFIPALKGGASTLVLASAGVGLVYVALPGEIGQADRLALALAGIAAAATQPVQLFARQTLHYSERSGSAVIVSSARYVTLLLAVFALMAAHAPAPAIPMSALTASNLTAIGAVWVSAARSPRATLNISILIHRGRFLLPSAVLPVAAGLLGSYFVAAIAGASYLGQAEAARLVAQPVGVLAMGLLAVGSPTLMETAHRRQYAAAWKLAAKIIGAIALFAAVYGIAVSVPWAFNVAESILPLAYATPGLVAVSIAAAALLGASMPFGAILIGAGKERGILVREIPASLFQILIALSASVTQAFARPLGVGASATTRIILNGALVRDLERQVRKGD